MMRAQRVVLGCVLALAASCSTPTSPPPSPPVTVELIADVMPAARSVGVSDLTPIWVDWVEAIDTTTVSDTTVRFKIDSRRIPVRRQWDAALMRLSIEPLAPLALARTHTIEISPGVRTMTGRHLTGTFLSQFTTRSLREHAHPMPADGAVQESPFVTLAWDSTEFAGARLAYDIFSGTDSAAVAAHTARRDTSLLSMFMRRTAWPGGTTTYWSVRTRDRITGERIDGPAWKFVTLPASTPIDSILVPLSDWGDCDRRTGVQHCFQTVFSSGDGLFTAAVRWDLRGVGPRKLANAVVRLVATQDLRIGPTPRTTLVPVTGHWSACAIGNGGPPYPDPLGNLATGGFATSRDIAFSSDVLTAHLEATLRRGLPPGYLVRTTNQLDYKGAESSMMLYVYRVPVTP